MVVYLSSTPHSYTLLDGDLLGSSEHIGSSSVVNHVQNNNVYSSFPFHGTEERDELKSPSSRTTHSSKLPFSVNQNAEDTPSSNREEGNYPGTAPRKSISIAAVESLPLLAPSPAFPGGPLPPGSEYARSYGAIELSERITAYSPEFMPYLDSPDSMYRSGVGDLDI